MKSPSETEFIVTVETESFNFCCRRHRHYDYRLINVDMITYSYVTLRINHQIQRLTEQVMDTKADPNS
jgi:hypothetical protein